MKRTAGQGLQQTSFEVGANWYQRASDLVSANPIATFQLPAGNWWKVQLLHAQLDATAGVGDVVYSARAVSSGVQLFFVTGLFAFTAGAFEGGLTFGLGLEPMDASTDDCLVGNLPDVYLPPGTSVSLEAIVGGGTLELANPIIIARSAANV
ncbi:MAG: hypothetical protein E6Q97_17785 [Desulfurellales bacterium]|nr:MAG: hypothetical protein E6Q97_17785 [Desulfurellales bacterium]